MSRGNRRPPRSSGPSGPKRGWEPGEIIFEFTHIGDHVRVAAIDAETGMEVVAFGPAAAAQADLERLALNKLRYVLRGAPPETPPSPRPGRLV